MSQFPEEKFYVDRGRHIEKEERRIVDEAYVLGAYEIRLCYAWLFDCD